MQFDRVICGWIRTTNHAAVVVTLQDLPTHVQRKSASLWNVCIAFKQLSTGNFPSMEPGNSYTSLAHATPDSFVGVIGNPRAHFADLSMTWERWSGGAVSDLRFLLKFCFPAFATHGSHWTHGTLRNLQPPTPDIPVPARPPR